MRPVLQGFTSELVKVGAVPGAEMLRRLVSGPVGGNAAEYRKAVAKAAAFAAGQNAFMGMFMGDRKESKTKRLLHAGVGGTMEGAAMGAVFPRMFMGGH